MPEITILMPVRNGERYIKEAIDSVLRQTFTDFELVIIDDGSKDSTVEIIQGYDNERIYLRKRKHQFVLNLNEGLKWASGSYIARMDADDIMHTERLRIQLKRMKKNPDIVVCGTWGKIFSDNGKERKASHLGYGIVREPVFELLKHNKLLHPSVMMKKEFLLDHNIEYQNYPYLEDYKLWFDIAKAGGTLFVEPQELLMLRKSDLQITVTKKKEMHAESIRLREEILSYLLTINPNKISMDLLSNFENLEKSQWITNKEIFDVFINILSKRT